LIFVISFIERGEKMILTLTLNPAVDKTITISGFTINEVNRVEDVRLDPGGKGINVSKTIKALGHESTALGLLAGEAGRYIESALSQLNIAHQFMMIQGETRTNTKIVDPLRNTNTDINEKGPAIDQKTLDQKKKLIYSILKPGDILVLSGSVPQGVPESIYQELIDWANNNDVKVILDADGPLLREGIKAKPYMVKPNLRELERLFQVPVNSVATAIPLGRRLIQQGISHVIISLGGDGALLIDTEKVLYATGLVVDVISTVGAGDAMVAALAVALDQGKTLEEAARLAVATSAASVMTGGTQPGNLETIKDLQAYVQVKEWI